MAVGEILPILVDVGGSMLGFEFRRKGLNNRLADDGLRAGGEEDVSGDGETSDDESIC